MIYLDDLSVAEDLSLTPEESRKLHDPDYTSPDRFRIMVRVWDDTTHRYRPTFFYEPHEAVIRLCLAELAPLLARAATTKCCICEDQAYNLQIALAETKTAVKGFQLLLPLVDHLPTSVLDTIDPLTDECFDSMQAAATALKQALSSTDLDAYGEALMQAVRPMVMDEATRHDRIAYLEAQLAQWEATPTRPAPKEGEVVCCPVCHLPYRYSVWELLRVEHRAISRIITHLIGGPLYPGDVPLVLAKIEEWLYALTDEVDAAKKKLTTDTTMMLMMTRFTKAINANRDDLRTRLTAVLTGTSATEGSTAPPTVPVTPPASSA